jgi:hypothetical protein
MIIAISLKFYNHSFSNNISDWGAMGDYFGGLLNPFISLFSLILLAKVSIEVAKIGSESNKELFIYEQQNKIYQEVIQYYSDLLITKQNFTDLINLSNQEAIHQNKKTQTILYEESTELRKIKKVLANSVSYFFLFESKYGHFYSDFNFKSKDFNAILENSKNLHSSFDELYKDIIEINELEDLNIKIQLFYDQFNSIAASMDSFGKYLSKKVS